jgi:hypothetical protein
MVSDNERARARAIAAGKDTFPYEVVETWAGCVTCGRRIFRTALNVKRPGLYRLCACPGVVWQQDVYGQGWKSGASHEMWFRLEEGGDGE